MSNNKTSFLLTSLISFIIIACLVYFPFKNIKQLADVIQNDIYNDSLIEAMGIEQDLQEGPISKTYDSYQARDLIDKENSLDLIEASSDSQLAQKISQASFESSKLVFLVNPENTMNVNLILSLAAHIQAPVLYSSGHELPKESIQEIQRLGAQSAIIVGDEGDLNSDFKGQVQELGLQTGRLSADTIYELSARVAKEMSQVNPEALSRTAFLVNDQAEEDLTAAVAMAAQQKSPIILTDGEEFDTNIEQSLEMFESWSILGDQNQVSAQLEEDLKAVGNEVVRLQGEDVYETNRLLLDHFGINSQSSLVASGEGPASALVFSILAGLYDQPILYVKDNDLANLEEQVSFSEDQGVDNYSLVSLENSLNPFTADVIAQPSEAFTHVKAGIQAGQSIMSLYDQETDKGLVDYLQAFSQVENPVMTKEIVSDRQARGIADPFIVYDYGNQRYHAFFEVLSFATEEIGHAYSDDLKNWVYTEIVLAQAEVGHRSAYPYIFRENGEWYMIPDSNDASIRLYRARNFPGQWELETVLIEEPGKSFSDTNVFEYQGVWYLTTTGGTPGWNGVHLYYNDSENGQWKNNQWVLHPKHQLVKDYKDKEMSKRNAGRPIINEPEGYVLFPVQNMPASTNIYGEYTNLYCLTELTKETVEVENMFQFTYGRHDGSWESLSAHHAAWAPYKDSVVFITDGQNVAQEYAIGLYEIK